MTTYLIPNDAALVEEIAKSIAKNRLFRDAEAKLTEIVGSEAKNPDMVDRLIEKLFEELWNGISEFDERQRKSYRNDALAAIRTINLKLMTTIE